MACKNSLILYLEKYFFLRGPPPRFWPACRSRPSIHPTSPPSPRPSSIAVAQSSRALSSPPARRARPCQASRAAWRAHAGDAGRVASRGPRKHARRAVITPPLLRIQAVQAQHPLTQPAAAAPPAHSELRHRAPLSLRQRFAPPPAPHSPIPPAGSSASSSSFGCARMWLP